jgi:hypothetical protein
MSKKIRTKSDPSSMNNFLKYQKRKQTPDILGVKRA